MLLTKSSSGDQTRVQSLSTELEETKQRAEQSSQEHLAQLEALKGTSISTVSHNLRSYIVLAQCENEYIWQSTVCQVFYSLFPPSLPPSLPLSCPSLPLSLPPSQVTTSWRWPNLLSVYESFQSNWR